MSEITQQEMELYRMEPIVAGDSLSISLRAFLERSHFLLREEQAKVAPDNVLIAHLCDTIRFVREHVQLASALLTGKSKPTEATGLDDQQNADAGGLPTLSDPASAWRIDSGGNSPPRAIMDAASRSPVENRDSGAVASSAEGHPEDACERCGRLNVVWFTRNELWNRIPPTHDILCPCCFVQLAEESGLVPTGWLLIPEDLDLLSVVDAQAERIKNLVNDQRAYALCVGADPDKVPEAEVLETACRLWAEMKVNADLVAAQAERIRDLEQDAARLDWLDANDNLARYRWSSSAPTNRAAIDAARSATQEEWNSE